MNPEQQEFFKEEQVGRPILIFTDGAGRRPDGTGSAYGFFRPDTGEKQIIYEDGLTNNQAEYKGIISALESFPFGSAVKLQSDSEVAIAQIHGNYKAEDPSLRTLLRAVQEVICRKHLKVEFIWVPRSQNKAGKFF